MVRLGTKCPSITSQWITVAPPRTAALAASARRAKSADRMDGANSIKTHFSHGVPRRFYHAAGGDDMIAQHGARCPRFASCSWTITWAKKDPRWVKNQRTMASIDCRSLRELSLVTFVFMEGRFLWHSISAKPYNRSVRQGEWCLWPVRALASNTHGSLTIPEMEPCGGSAPENGR